MKTLNHILSILFLLMALTSGAQDASKAILSSSDIDRFIKTYKPLVKDLEKLGDKYENIEDPSMLQALAANEEVLAIFKKYGWSEDYILKHTVIAQGYAYMKMETEYEKLPDNQKTYMKQALEQYKVSLKDTVHPKDLELVKANLDRLEAFFDSLNE